MDERTDTTTCIKDTMDFKECSFIIDYELFLIYDVNVITGNAHHREK